MNKLFSLKRLPRQLRFPLVAAGILVAGAGSLAASPDLFEMSKNIEIFATLFKEVNTYYVDDINPGDFIRTAIDASLKTLDPYTNFYSESEIEDYRFLTTGQYGGIGAAITTRGDYIVVSDPYEDYPAAKADLRAGDVIVEIDGRSTKGKTTDEVSKMLKGSPGTEVKLTIERPGEKARLAKVLKREEVKVKNVPYYGMVNESTGYIRLTGFTNDAGKEVRNAFLELKKNTAMKAIILDLRGNPGGLLNEAVNIAAVWIPKSRLVVSTKGKVSEWDRDYRTSADPVDTTMPIAVLVNGSSASASEIVSGVMQDYDRGLIIGQKTYGKGLVQTTRTLAYNTQLKVTSAKYYTPSGRCIQAINYEDRDEEGKAKKVADSLRREFKTKGTGRTVLDAGGISPDLDLPVERYSNITASLLGKRLIFDYATTYRREHNAIPDGRSFHISDEEYAAFVKWLGTKEFDYTTETEKALAAWKEKAEKENYFEGAKAEYDALNAKFAHNKDKDLEKYKSEIRDVLEEEIASRYYHQKGRVEAGFDDDKEIQEATKALADLQRYNKLLKRS